ncbi:MAG: hypothetical protein ACE10G_10320 [Gemmatimonadales bacterium]
MNNTDGPEYPRGHHPNSLENLQPPFQCGHDPRRGRRPCAAGTTILRWINELLAESADDTPRYSFAEIRAIAEAPDDDPKISTAKRAAARQLVEMIKSGKSGLEALGLVFDRTTGRPPQAIHVTSEESTTIRVVLLDRTASPTHKMVEEIMRGELGADEPKQLEADEPKQPKAKADEQATKPEDQPAHPSARVGMDWRTASAGPVSDPT